MPSLPVLDTGLSGPVVVLDSDELRLDLIEMGKLGAGGSYIARPGGAERAAK